MMKNMTDSSNQTYVYSNHDVTNDNSPHDNSPLCSEADIDLNLHEDFILDNQVNSENSESHIQSTLFQNKNEAESSQNVSSSATECSTKLVNANISGTSINNSMTITKTVAITPITITTTSTTDTCAIKCRSISMVKRFAGKRKYKCIVCSKVFANMRNLKRHQINHSTDQHSGNTHQCPACDNSFKHSNSLIAHVKLHKAEGVDIYSCSQCSHVFTNESELKTHKERKCTLSKKHKCSDCNLKFRCISERISHEMTHIGNKPFKCSICGTSFSRKQSLKEHSRLHSRERYYKCKPCSRAFCFRSSLTFHTKKIHGDGRARPHSCTQCNKSFAVLSNLRNHLRIHSGEKQYLCPECGRGFTQSGTLQLHISTHSVDRPYKCLSCEKTFKRMDTMQRHMLTHTQEQPYKCDQCNNAYRHRRSLNTHMLAHTGTKPHTCSTCGKGFKRMIALKEHMHLHSAEKAHRCDSCGKEFALKRYLKKHLHIHNKDQMKPTDSKTVSRDGTDAAGEAIVMSDVGSVELPVETESHEELVCIDLDEAGISRSGMRASIVPVELHQSHFQPAQQITDNILSELNNSLSTSPVLSMSPIHSTKRQPLPISTSQISSELMYACPSPSETVTRLNHPQVNYAYNFAQPEHQVPLPHMSEAFNDLKMDKYADYATRKLCIATLPASFTCSNDEGVYNSMSLVQSHESLSTGVLANTDVYSREQALL